MILNDFIEKAKEIHGNKYDYSKVEYKNLRTKVCIICPKHGEFWQIPYSHLKGFGCSKCGHEKTNNSKVSNTFIFIEKARITSLIVGCYFTGYYILKNIVVFYKEKNKYLIDKSDIPQIIKKESQDELAQEEKLKRQKEPPERKRGRPRKDG